jgi:hypothetical protein
MKRIRIHQPDAATRLALRRETVIHLTSRQLAGAAGGGGPASNLSCIKTVCGPPQETD